MGKKGFVYIMSNPSMPGLIKVGMTRKVPSDRADDLISTAVPDSFEVQYYAFFDDRFSAEKAAHRKLKKYHYKKEFFKTDVATAIWAIEETGIPFKRLHSKYHDDIKVKEIAQQKSIEEEKKRREQAIKKRKRDIDLDEIEQRISQKEAIWNIFWKIWVMGGGVVLIAIDLYVFDPKIIGCWVMLLVGLIICAIGYFTKFPGL